MESEEENKQTGESTLYYILTVCMHWITTRSSVHLRKYRQCKCENLENKLMDPIDNYMYQVLGGHRQAQRRYRKRQTKRKRKSKETGAGNKLEQSRRSIHGSKSTTTEIHERRKENRPLSLLSSSAPCSAI